MTDPSLRSIGEELCYATQCVALPWCCCIILWIWDCDSSLQRNSTWWSWSYQIQMQCPTRILEVVTHPLPSPMIEELCPAIWCESQLTYYCFALWIWRSDSPLERRCTWWKRSYQSQVGSWGNLGVPWWMLHPTALERSCALQFSMDYVCDVMALYCKYEIPVPFWMEDMPDEIGPIRFRWRSKDSLGCHDGSITQVHGEGLLPWYLTWFTTGMLSYLTINMRLWFLL